MHDLLLLAPMEGLLDAMLRDALTRTGGIDRCVSEFIRVTDTLLPAKVYTRIVPELLAGGRTPSGVPVRPQLLGSDPACLADNAARLATLRPPGIDLNFGCPAKTVNRHRGGAVLLDEPELVGAIVAAVRRAVPPALPVSAKMRLGYRDRGRMLEAARAIAEAGACELVVHARTQADGYRPPAWWDHIAEIGAAVPIPVIANGEIWSVDDAARCRAASGTRALMLGRGMVADPGLARRIRQADARAADRPGAADDGALPWPDVQPLLVGYWRQVRRQLQPRHQAGRLKQWLRYLQRTHPEAAIAHERIRTLQDPREVARQLGLPADA